MLVLALVSAVILQDAPVAYPPTPQQFRGRTSGFVQGTLNVAAGERATLRLNADGTYDLVGVDRIAVGDVLPPAEGSTGTINGAEAGTLRFGLHARQDIGSVLKVENGQTQGLGYAGYVVRYVGGQARGPEATSVCTVPPGMVTYEHWPEPVIQVVVGGLRRSDDTVPTCPPHRDAAPTVAEDALSPEGERLGRYSTLFALCEPYYAVDLAAGRRLADDFVRRSTEAGWTSQRRASAYARGRDLERAEVGVSMDRTGVTRQAARRHLRDLYPRLKTRCQDLAQQVPGSVSDVEAGNLRLDAAARRYR
ncbi:hypothetical protein [Brevundimonas variabilis]|uniref:Uncharacterized protein n=1 Tax=Brevundimonas variabilis TaxID=74312 RepID=A0A7W9CG19_9CAUL|nr:hypothetical protein [Brevundimonas variabilis]MBB5744512.1 hypothetical protein [Brevundimonas variabilis]